MFALQDKSNVNGVVSRVLEMSGPLDPRWRDVWQSVATTDESSVYAILDDDEEKNHIITMDRVLDGDPALRAKVFLIKTGTALESLAHEMKIRLEIGKMFHLDDLASITVTLIVLPGWLERLKDLEQRFKDGDEIISLAELWPTGSRFWETNDYAPFADREDMLDAHAAAIHEHQSSTRDSEIILFNAGSDFMIKYHDMVDGVIIPSEDVFERNMKARREKASRGGSESSHPTDPEQSIEQSRAYARIAHRHRVPIFRDFGSLKYPGLYLAASGAGKSSYIKKTAPGFTEPDASVIFDNAVDRVGARSKFFKRKENGPQARLSISSAGIRDYGKDPKWVKILRATNALTYTDNDTPTAVMARALLAKAGECGVVVTDDEDMIPFNPVKKSIDPLSVQIGKMNGKVVAFVDSLIQRGVSRDFAEMYFYLMVGADTTDVTREVYYGICPQMINHNRQIYSCQLWSTSLVGKLFFNVTKTSVLGNVVPLFPELLSLDMPKVFSEEMERVYVVTEMDFALGLYFSTTNKRYHEHVREFEWCLLSGPRISNGSARCVLRARADILRESLTVFKPGEGSRHGLFLYFQMVNSAIMGMGKTPLRLMPETVLEKVRLRIEEGVDRSGHMMLASGLPLVHMQLYAMSILLNLHGSYDATGIYGWEGLPTGKWHTVDDYLNAVDFGLERHLHSPRRQAVLQLLKRYLNGMEKSKECVLPDQPLIDAAYQCAATLAKHISDV